MSFIEALQISDAARDWLAHSRRPHILHVFDHACNLINERREVLCLVPPQIGCGPFNLVIEAGTLFSAHLDVQSRIFIHADQLDLDDLTIGIRSARPWSSSPNWRLLHGKRREMLDQLTSLPIPDSLPLLPNRLISDFALALAAADISSALAMTRQLAGLGPGLTPAGDDFILGAVLAAWIVHPPGVGRALAEEIANSAAPLTTSLSAAWLRSAGRGEAGILWHEFFDTLISMDKVQIQEAAGAILAMGETSGADALAGFFSAFVIWAELERSKVS